MEPKKRLLMSVLNSAAILQRIAGRLDCVSDATELPFDQRELSLLAASVGNVTQLLLTGEELLKQEVERWGL